MPPTTVLYRNLDSRYHNAYLDICELFEEDPSYATPEIRQKVSKLGDLIDRLEGGEKSVVYELEDLHLELQDEIFEPHSLDEVIECGNGAGLKPSSYDPYYKPITTFLNWHLSKTLSLIHNVKELHIYLVGLEPSDEMRSAILTFRESLRQLKQLKFVKVSFSPVTSISEAIKSGIQFISPVELHLDFSRNQSRSIGEGSVAKVLASVNVSYLKLPLYILPESIIELESFFSGLARLPNIKVDFAISQSIKTHI